MVNVHTQSDGLRQPGGRLNVLVTENRPHAPEHWTAQLPRLLNPQGVVSYLARSAQEAIEVADLREIHAAVIDLATPRDPHGGRPDDTRGGAPGRRFGGMWLSELLKRLPDRPPVVIINSPAHTDRQAARLLQEALRLGAFSVMNKPVGLEQLLVVLQRLLERRYKGAWPAQRGPNTGASPFQ